MLKRLFHRKFLVLTASLCLLATLAGGAYALVIMQRNDTPIPAKASIDARSTQKDSSSSEPKPEPAPADTAQNTEPAPQKSASQSPAGGADSVRRTATEPTRISVKVFNDRWVNFNSVGDLSISYLIVFRNMTTGVERSTSDSLSMMPTPTGSETYKYAHAGTFDLEQAHIGLESGTDYQLYVCDDINGVCGTKSNILILTTYPSETAAQYPNWFYIH